MTPKQRRLRKQPTDTPAKQVDAGETMVLDEQFDEAETADAEFARWRWPERLE